MLLLLTYVALLVLVCVVFDSHVCEYRFFNSNDKQDQYFDWNVKLCCVLLARTLYRYNSSVKFKSFKILFRKHTNFDRLCAWAMEVDNLIGNCELLHFFAARRLCVLRWAGFVCGSMFTREMLLYKRSAHYYYVVILMPSVLLVIWPFWCAYEAILTATNFENNYLRKVLFWRRASKVWNTSEEFFLLLNQRPFWNCMDVFP